MSTAAQQQANTQNAKHSTGPRSEDPIGSGDGD